MGLHASHYLNTSLPGHTWLIAFLYLAEINSDLETFRRQMNNRKVSTAKNFTPKQMFYAGSMRHGLRGLDPIPKAAWDQPGVISREGEDVIDPVTYGAGGEGRWRDIDPQQPDEERDLDEQVRQQQELFDPRCPFVHTGYKEELTRRIYAQDWDRDEPSAKWEAALTAMEDMLSAGWGH